MSTLVRLPAGAHRGDRLVRPAGARTRWSGTPVPLHSFDGSVNDAFDEIALGWLYPGASEAPVSPCVGARIVARDGQYPEGPTDPLATTEYEGDDHEAPVELGAAENLYFGAYAKYPGKWSTALNLICWRYTDDFNRDDGPLADPPDHPWVAVQTEISGARALWRSQAPWSGEWVYSTVKQLFGADELGVAALLHHGGGMSNGGEWYVGWQDLGVDMQWYTPRASVYYEATTPRWKFSLYAGSGATVTTGWIAGHVPDDARLLVRADSDGLAAAFAGYNLDTAYSIGAGMGSRRLFFRLSTFFGETQPGIYLDDYEAFAVWY